MSTIYASNTHSAIGSALIGMGSASRVMEHAAQNIAKRGIEDVNQGSNRMRDNVSLSNQTQGLLETSSMETDIINMMQAGTTYTANANVVKAADAMVGSLLDMVA